MSDKLKHTIFFAFWIAMLFVGMIWLYDKAYLYWNINHKVASWLFLFASLTGLVILALGVIYYADLLTNKKQ